MFLIKLKIDVMDIYLLLIVLNSQIDHSISFDLQTVDSSDIRFVMDVLHTTKFKHVRKDCEVVTIEDVNHLIPPEVPQYTFGKLSFAYHHNFLQYVTTLS